MLSQLPAEETCPTCGSLLDHQTFEAVQGRLRSDERRTREELRSELHQQHQLDLTAALSQQETQLRTELLADAERTRREALAGQRKSLEAERDATKTELANVRFELDGARSKYEEDLERATALASKLKEERTKWQEDETRRIAADAQIALAEERSRIGEELDTAKTALAGAWAQLEHTREEHEGRICELESLREADVHRIEQEVRASLAEERSHLEAERAASHAELAGVQTRLRETIEEHQRRVKELEDLREAEARSVEADVRRAVAEEKLTLERDRDDARAQAEALEAAHHAELVRQREVLTKELERALAAKDSQASAERESLKREVADLQRKVEGRTANELGEGGEIDLFESLREAFPEDRISRIPKGQPGADVRHEIKHAGETCGTILYDSKNHKSWRTSFAEKLKSDQVDEGADHAILSTLRFPEGENHITTVCDVIVTGPRHVVQLAQLLRRSVIGLHVQGMSLKDRANKQEALYKHISSGPFRQQLEELDRLNEQMGEIEVEEERRHQRTWKERGKLITRQKRALAEVAVGVGGIIEGVSCDEGA
jgi:hypothetical protein